MREEDKVARGITIIIGLVLIAFGSHKAFGDIGLYIAIIFAGLVCIADGYKK